MRLPAAEETRLSEGVRLFNEGRFFEAHEVWEELWTPTRGPERLFLQSIIHLAVGLYHTQQRNREGAVRQLRKGLKKLAGYLPEAYGLDTLALYRRAIACLERIECGDCLADFPVIVFSERMRSPVTGSRSDRRP